MKEELPLWLERAAVIAGPAAELTDLLRFEPRDLERVQAAHQLANSAIGRLLDQLSAALRAPRPDTERPHETAASVRGPIDWPRTTTVHAAGQTASYVTRPRRRTFDTPEHRALRWTLARLRLLAARTELVTPAEDAVPNDATLGARLAAVERAARAEARTAWLADLPAQRPTAMVRRRLARSRSAFMRHALAPAVDVLLADLPAGEELAALLKERYFVPEKDWRLYEVVVLVRLDRAFAAVSVDSRRHRLLADGGVAAGYKVRGGETITLRQQGWPRSTGGHSRRQQTAARHGIAVAATVPDIILDRTGPDPDRIILELKASRVPATLGAGLSQLLGYLHERPSLFDHNPAGWLVPLPGATGKSQPISSEPLWIVDADHVADAAVARMVGLAGT